MTNDVDESAALIYLALNRTLDSRKELLPYLKNIILAKFKEELENITDEDIKGVLEEYEQAIKSREP